MKRARAFREPGDVDRPVASLLRCIACGAELADDGRALRCSLCGHADERVAEIPTMRPGMSGSM